MGRTECNRIVNFDAGPLGERLVGRMVPLEITQAFPHSLRGRVAGAAMPRRNGHHSTSAQAATIAP
jgi:hypothetical protein